MLFSWLQFIFYQGLSIYWKYLASSYRQCRRKSDFRADTSEELGFYVWRFWADFFCLASLYQNILAIFCGQCWQNSIFWADTTSENSTILVDTRYQRIFIEISCWFLPMVLVELRFYNWHVQKDLDFSSNIFSWELFCELFQWYFSETSDKYSPTVSEKLGYFSQHYRG